VEQWQTSRISGCKSDGVFSSPRATRESDTPLQGLEVDGCAFSQGDALRCMPKGFQPLLNTINNFDYLCGSNDVSNVDANMYADMV
jgi:hypothetical protein